MLRVPSSELSAENHVNSVRGFLQGRELGFPASLGDLLQQVTSPALEGAPAFLEVLGPVVDAGDPALGGAADMVDDGFDDMGPDAEVVVHACDDGAPQVMQPPIGHAAALIEALFRSAPAGEWRFARGGEHVCRFDTEFFLLLQLSAQDRQDGRRQRDDVRLFVLGSVAREFPGPAIEIDLRPCRFSGVRRSVK